MFKWIGKVVSKRKGKMKNPFAGQRENEREKERKYFNKKLQMGKIRNEIAKMLTNDKEIFNLKFKKIKNHRRFAQRIRIGNSEKGQRVRCPKTGSG